MIKTVSGDMFQSNHEAMVNPVNCVGVMGKGIAAQFKQLYPKMFEEYQGLCLFGIPAIGYRNGKLDWNIVKPYIIEILDSNLWLKEWCDITIYEPQ